MRVQLSKDQSLRYGDLFPKGSTHTTEGEEEKKNERRGNDIRTEGVKVEAEKIHSGGGGGAWENAQQSTGEEEEGRRGFDTVKVLKKGDVEKKKFHDNNQKIFHGRNQYALVNRSLSFCPALMGVSFFVY